MARVVKCPKCGQGVEVPPGAGPHVLRCTGCGSSLRVGAPKAAAHGSGGGAGDTKSGSTVVGAITRSGPAIVACDVCGETFPADKVTRRGGEIICADCLTRREAAGNNETMAGGNAETIAEAPAYRDSEFGEDPLGASPADAPEDDEAPLGDTRAFGQLCSICAQEFDPREMIRHEGDYVCRQCAASIGAVEEQELPPEAESKSKKKAKKVSAEDDIPLAPRKKRRRKGIPISAILGVTSGFLFLITQIALFVIPGPPQLAHRPATTEPSGRPRVGAINEEDILTQVRALYQSASDLKQQNQPAKAVVKEQQALQLVKGHEAEIKNPTLKEIIVKAKKDSDEISATLATQPAAPVTPTVAQAPGVQPTVPPVQAPGAAASATPAPQAGATTAPANPTVAANVPATPTPPGPPSLFVENAPPEPAPPGPIASAAPMPGAPGVPTVPAPAKPTIVGPTTSPIPGVQLVEPADPLAALLQRGLNALSAQQYPAAIEAFSDARTFTYRPTRTGADPTSIFIDSGLGAAYLGAGRLDKASGPLNRAQAGPFNRSAFLNKEAMDIQIKLNIFRAIKDLRENLGAQQGVPDEAMLNLLGTAIDRASVDVKPDRAAQLESARAFYVACNGRLESTHPGEKRWGTSWIPQAKYDALVAARTEATQKNTELSHNVELKLMQYTAAKQAADQAKINTPNTADASQQMVFQAQTELADARDGLAKAQASLPVSEWLQKFDPVLPQMPAMPAMPHGAGEADISEQAAAGPTTLPEGSRLIVRTAAGFPVGPDLILTVAAPLKDATDIGVRPANGQTVRATLVRKDDSANLALLRVEGAKFGRFSVAPSFVGGDITCAGYPDVAPGSAAVALPGRATPPRPKWIIRLQKHPRLPGAPIFNHDNEVVGLLTAERDADPMQLSADSVDQLVNFLGPDRNAAGDRTNDISNVVEVIATYQK